MASPQSQCKCSVGEEGLECPVCWESFDASANTPYVLWCGHSLCRACVLALPWAAVKRFPVQLPLFVACPWCQFLTLRLRWKGHLRHPCKNFFLLWIVEGARHSHARNYSEDTEPIAVFHLLSPRTPPPPPPLAVSARGAGVVASFWQFMARIPLVLLFLVVVVYVLPFSALVLALYCFITVVFAVPSFLVVYFSYPSLDWLVRAIAS